MKTQIMILCTLTHFYSFPFRRPLTAFLPIIILGVAYLIAFRRTVRVIKAVENAKLKKTDPKNVQQGTSKSKPETRDEVSKEITHKIDTSAT